jgi:hypothetical protein
MSNSSSQRRLRALMRADSDEISLTQTRPAQSSTSTVLNNNLVTPELPDLPLFNSPRNVGSSKDEPSKSGYRNKFYWIFFTYCTISVVLFTLRLCSIARPLWNSAFQNGGANHGLSPINDFPHSYRMARLLSMEPSMVSFVPYVFRARKRSPDNAVTACLWAEVDQLKDLESWSGSWIGKYIMCKFKTFTNGGQGPLSIVLVTDSDPQESEWLIRKLKRLPNLKARANVHVLQRMVHQHRSSNSYLNIARLFAKTRFVTLLPTSTSVPASLYGATIAHIEKTQNQSQLSYPVVLAPPKTTRNSLIPFQPLSPLLVEQQYPVWCSERFFSSPTREDDWEECLWQFWLNSYGMLRSLPEPNWTVHRNRSRDTNGAISVEVRGLGRS